MAKEYARRFYNSKAWKQCRSSFISYRISIDGGMCQQCKDELGFIVDHKEEITPGNINNPDITLNHNNFRYLCLSCHTQKTFGNDARYVFNSKGEVIPI